MSQFDTSRRRFVTAIAAGAAGALAGCLSNGRGAGEQAPGRPLAVPTKGDPDAAVTAAVYEDVGCPHCATYQTDVLPAVEREYLESGEVRYEFHDLIIPADDRTPWEAASAARSVQDRGDESMFWAYLDGLFENQDDLGPEMYEALAAELELDGTAVREDATEQAYDETVSHDTSEAEDAGVDGTPTVVIDGSVVEWGDEIAFEPVAEAIDEALQ